MSEVTGADGQEPDAGKQPIAVEPDHSVLTGSFEPPKLYQRIDGAVFSVEAAIVTATTALMTLFIFFSILFEFANGQFLRMKTLHEAGELAKTETWGFYWVQISGALEIIPAVGDPIVFPKDDTTFHLGELAPTTLAILGLFTLFLGIVSAHPWSKVKPRVTRFLLAFCGLSAFFAFVVLMLRAHPKWTCLTVAFLGGAYAAVYLARRKSSIRDWAVLVLAVGAFAGFSTTVGERFSSWTHSYAMFLLLWTCFIGASMATSKAKHLRIDAARKAVPREYMGRYNAVSFLFAALFTGAFCYLSATYFVNRLGGQTTEGEIPDWLKVLAIPVALGIVTLRFLFRSLWGALGYVEPLGEEVVLPTAEQSKEAA